MFVKLVLANSDSSFDMSRTFTVLLYPISRVTELMYKFVPTFEHTVFAIPFLLSLLFFESVQYFFVDLQAVLF